MLSRIKDFVYSVLPGKSSSYNMVEPPASNSKEAIARLREFGYGFNDCE